MSSLAYLALDIAVLRGWDFRFEEVRTHTQEENQAGRMKQNEVEWGWCKKVKHSKLKQWRIAAKEIMNRID